MKPVNNYPGYCVGVDGSVHSMKRVVKDRQGKPRTIPYRRLKPYQNKKTGIYSVTLCKDGRCKSVSVAKLVAETYFRDTGASYFVDFADGDRSNCCSTNLIVNSIKGNQKLVQSDVVKIRGLYADGVSMKIIAKQFQISQSHVSNILSGRYWKVG